jgi:hypothetical protein
MPVSLVVTDRIAPVSVLEMFTVTPGSTPPCESVTVPSMAPLAACDWASAGEERERTTNNAASVREIATKSSGWSKTRVYLC